MPRKLVYLGVVALTFLHQDFWLRDDPSLVGGVLPAGLFYHAVYSLACGAFWLYAVCCAWPDLSGFAYKEEPPEPPER